MIWRYGDQIGWGPFVQGDQIFGDNLSKGTKFDGDSLFRGTKLVGDHLSMGTKFWGTICPWGQEVGDRKFGDQMGAGPNESQPPQLIILFRFHLYENFILKYQHRFFFLDIL